MTFKEWIANPSGKGSAVMTHKDMYHKMYNDKLNLVILREGNTFNYTLYKKDDYLYLIHMKVPSEVIKGFYYDVVIEFSTTNSAYAAGGSLDKYDVRLFSNSPDFMFTHAHAYNKSGLLFADLSAKLPKQSLTEVAKERNPKDQIGYVKSIFFAYLICVQKGLLNKVVYYAAKPYVKKDLLNLITHASDIYTSRQEAEADKRAVERRKKSLEIKKANEEKRSAKSTKSTSSSNTVKYTNKSSSVRTSKTVKKK